MIALYRYYLLVNYAIWRYYHLHMRIAPLTIPSADHVERKRHAGRAAGGVPQTRLRSRLCGNRPGDPDSRLGSSGRPHRRRSRSSGRPRACRATVSGLGNKPRSVDCPTGALTMNLHQRVNRFLAEWISTSISRRSRSWERDSRSSRCGTSQRTTRIAVPTVPSSPTLGEMSSAKRTTLPESRSTPVGCCSTRCLRRVPRLMEDPAAR